MGLERYLPQSGGVRTLLPKILLSQLLVNPLWYLPLFYAWTGAVLGHTQAQTLEKARREYWVTLKATWLFFVPFNAVNFSLVPVHHQAAKISSKYRTVSPQVHTVAQIAESWDALLFSNAVARACVHGDVGDDARRVTRSPL